MISQSTAERVLDRTLESGADFAEIFSEETQTLQLRMADSKPNSAVQGRMHGIGIRALFGLEQLYFTTNDSSEAALLELASTFKSIRKLPKGAAVQPMSSKFTTLSKSSTMLGADKSFGFLQRMDRSARKRNSAIVQVYPSLSEVDQRILIFNSSGVWAEDQRNYCRAGVEVLMQDKGASYEANERAGSAQAHEYFDTVDFESLAHRAADRAALLIHADFAPAGEMPVVIDHGMGGVIFHEACGHGLETTSVGKDASVFCGKLGQRVAADCVTAIDEGLTPQAFGTLRVDDEGMPVQKTVLIEKGILKNYISDILGERQTGFKRTGSGRRQDYRFPPTSRMRNTFIDAGTTPLEKMIADIDYGLFAKSMGGGSVDTGTGDYNFGVVEGYLIRNGKIDKPVKGAALIGRGIETLERITAVGPNLSSEIGMCGSISGSIPVTVGQPSILVSKILVGGRAQG